MTLDIHYCRAKTNELVPRVDPETPVPDFYGIITYSSGSKRVLTAPSDLVKAAELLESSDTETDTTVTGQRPRKLLRETDLDSSKKITPATHSIHNRARTQSRLERFPALPSIGRMRCFMAGNLQASSWS